MVAVDTEMPYDQLTLSFFNEAAVRPTPGNGGMGAEEVMS
ncbi:hypothetical protein SynWH8103_01500 [Synechococcus sp. WH 8103]|nr:hypothetical protein SynWH8103_01500 [Synechococcus sp. WH 8103]